MTNLSKNKIKWWRKTIAYEIYVSSFYDSNNDGIGDLNGIRKKLDYLEQLHIGALWLTPVYASPMKDNGYDVSDYYKINPVFGTMEDMDNLIKEASSHNIKIIMDLVVNHTSSQCEWFKKSCKREKGYENFYIWKDPKKDGTPPNNWRSIFGGSAWTWNEERKQYYLHTFLKEQPDLNWADQHVRNEVYKLASFWLDKGIGGFRLDAIPYIKKPEGMDDGIPDSSDGMVDIHSQTCNQDGILDYLHEFKDKVLKGKDIFTVGEANGVPAAELNKWVGDDGVFDMIFDFNQFSNENIWYLRKPQTLMQLKTALSRSVRSLPESGCYPIFLENHDLPRSVSSFCLKGSNNTLGAKALGTILLMMKGLPFVYQGEELGSTNCSWKKEEYLDPNSSAQFDLALENGFNEEQAENLINECARDNSRTPMQWNDLLYGGFSLVKPWIKVNPDYLNINVENEEKDTSSVLNWYKTLSLLRVNETALYAGDYQLLLEDDENIFAFSRNYNDKFFLIMVNFALQDAHYNPQLTQNYKLLFDSIHLSKEGILHPLEARIYHN